MIALLSVRPFRRGNFTSIEIGRHLIKRGDTWWLHFEPDEVKNGIEIDVPFPEELVEWLELYRSVYRPLLTGDKLTNKSTGRRYVGERS